MAVGPLEMSEIRCHGIAEGWNVFIRGRNEFTDAGLEIVHNPTTHKNVARAHDVPQEINARRYRKQFVSARMKREL